MGVFETLRRIVATSKSSGSGSQLDQKYHTRIVGVGIAFGILGLIAGGVVVTANASDPDPQASTRDLALLILLGGVAGFLFGMAVTCAFAPQTFLMGPIGQRWMKLIGTKSVVVARLACLLFGTLGFALILGFGWHTLQTP